MNKIWITAIAMAVASGALSGCSIKKMAANAIADSLAGGGSVYTSDEDPDLVREALPFGLKTFESLLQVTPQHAGLLLATASGFSSYAYLLNEEADRIDERDFREAQRLRARASKLFLRGRDYAFRGLELEHPDFARRLLANRDAALADTDADDTAFLFWAGAAWAGAVSTAIDDQSLMVALPVAAALVARSMELDESFDGGTAHEFFISYEGSRFGGDPDVVRHHYRRALALSGGTRASVHLALAETVVLQEQDLPEFRRLIAAARAVDPDAVPELRLVNTMAIRRAEWLETRIPDLFLIFDE